MWGCPTLSKALLLVVVLLLAGCLQGGLPITSLKDTVPVATSSYTFRAPVAFDGRGAPVSGVDFANLPVGIESLIPGTGAEPNIGITPAGTVLVTSFDQTYRSTDLGKSWSLAVDLVGVAYPMMEDYFTTSDPDLWVDPDTGRIFVDQMNPAVQCTWLQISDKEGEPGSWTERPMACTIPLLDHQKVMTAKPGPKSTQVMTAYPNVVYMCVNKRFDPYGVSRIVADAGMGTACAMSYDGGLTWPIERQVYINDQLCSNINGHPAAWPDGTVGMVLGNLGGNDCKRPLTVAISEDSGLTWESRVCDKSLGQKEIDADITVTPDGTAYLLYRDSDQLAHLLRSKDKFATCDHFKIAPPDHTLSTFAGITSGDDGRIAMAFLGTRDAQEIGATPSNATPGSAWHLFVTTSTNAQSDEPTFVTQQVTPDADPVQIGCVWLGGGGGGPFACRNLLDFIDMHRDVEGRWFIAITEGCTPRNGCAGAPDRESDYQSRDSQIGVIVQDSGWSLFAAKGILPSVGLEWPALEAR